jgi:hypothetical protein
MALKPIGISTTTANLRCSVDKTFADLRVWVDANSNGNTDGGELKTLAELNIVSIGTGKTAVNVADENGNLNTFKGNYTNTSGEVVDGTRSFNLLQNTFHRDWPNSPNIPPDVAALPNMQGSGAVRNLHEAMSLGTPQSLVLKNTVKAFAAATTRGAQYGLIDQLLMQWGSTSGFEDLGQRLENIKSSIPVVQRRQRFVWLPCGVDHRRVLGDCRGYQRTSAMPFIY